MARNSFEAFKAKAEADIEKLVNLLQPHQGGLEEIVTRIIPNKGLGAICVVFNKAREATAEEYGIIKEFAMDEMYRFEEDLDKNPEGTEIYFYILSREEAPF